MHCPGSGCQRIRFLAHIRQGLGLAVLARELIRNQDHLGSCILHLAAVHHQVRIRIAVSLFRNQDTVQSHPVTQLGNHIGMALLIGKEHILIGQDDAHEVDILAVVFEAVLNDRIVEMVVGGNLVAGSHAVAGNNGSVHDFRWIHGRWV